MSKLVNNEGKNKLNKTYELFENSVKELNKLISYKTLDEYNVFLGFLKGRKNSFDKAVGEAIDSVYVKGILDEEDIVTGCPTDIVKFNKDYKTSKTKELIEAGLVEEDIEMGKKNIIEESVKNNKTNIKLTKDSKSYRDYMLAQVDVMKDVFLNIIDTFADEVRNSDNKILDIAIEGNLIKEVEENFSKFISKGLQESSFADELIEPLKQLMEINVDKEASVEGDIIEVKSDSNLAYFIVSVLSVENNGDIKVEPNKITISDDNIITGKKAKDIYSAVKNLMKCGKEEVKEEQETNETDSEENKTGDVKEEVIDVEIIEENKETEINKEDKVEIKTQVKEIKVPIFSINISDNKIKLTVKDKVTEIDKCDNNENTALKIIDRILQQSNICTLYSYAVLSNYSDELIVNIIEGKVKEFELSKLSVKVNVDEQANKLLAL